MKSARQNKSLIPHPSSLILTGCLGGLTVLCFILLGCGVSSTEDGGAVVALSPFDGEKAFHHVEHVVGFGPRPPGSATLAKTAQYILDQLKDYGVETEEQGFVAKTPLGDKNMKNIIGKVPGKSDKVIIIAGHYDTKLFYDFAFLGANDGGSSTGFLLEMARVLSLEKDSHEAEIWLVFFDGEEALVNWTETDSLYGSRYMARKLKEDGRLSRIKAMILVDMIGDKELAIRKVVPSAPAWLTEAIWSTAAEQGRSKYFPNTTESLGGDDHIPFVKAGVAAIDLIDFRYGPGLLAPGAYWHTANDTLDKISPRSLQVVGDVVYHSLGKIEKH